MFCLICKIENQLQMVYIFSHAWLQIRHFPLDEMELASLRGVIQRVSTFVLIVHYVLVLSEGSESLLGIFCCLQRLGSLDRVCVNIMFVDGLHFILLFEIPMYGCAMRLMLT